MSYAAAVEHLLSLAPELAVPADPSVPRRKFDLDHMRILVAALDHPERKFRSVLIAGTNGKGSTASTLASIFSTAGYRAGLYTSPHLERINERIRIGSIDISEDDFAALYFRVDDAANHLVTAGSLPYAPSFFERITALAFLYFAESAVDIAILEVGMGGRLDATNIVDPLVSVITDISLDHMDWLGDTITAIAREKAGILRPNGVLVTLAQHPEANQAIGEIATALNVIGVNALPYMPAMHASVRATSATIGEDDAYPLSILGEEILVRPALRGTHQHRNIALAIAAAIEIRNRYSYKLTAADIATGITQTRWPGRLESFSLAQPGGSTLPLILDVAHNPAGAWALRAAISHLPYTGSRILIFGCLGDKAIAEMEQILFPIFDRVILTPVPSPRAASIAEMSAAAASTGTPVEIAEDIPAAINLAQLDSIPDSLVVAAGSVYLVGAIRHHILGAHSG